MPADHFLHETKKTISFTLFINLCEVTLLMVRLHQSGHWVVVQGVLMDCAQNETPPSAGPESKMVNKMKCLKIL